jgi:hypothetical protein
MSAHDIEYYRRREQQERESAQRTDDNGARRIHLEMAERYSAMLSESANLTPVSQARA